MENGHIEPLRALPVHREPGGQGATWEPLKTDLKIVFLKSDRKAWRPLEPLQGSWRVLKAPGGLWRFLEAMPAQGATLQANMPAAAYVALSRVEYDANWRFVGTPASTASRRLDSTERL